MTKGHRSHKRIVRSGLELASQRGLSRVTLGELASRVAMSKSGLFAHFASKVALQIELLDSAEATLLDHVVTPCADLPRGLPKLRGIVDRWLDWAQSAGLPGGCPLYAATFELDDMPGPARDHLVRRHEAWTELLAGLVRDAVDEGHLPPDTDPVQVVRALEGIYLAHHVAWRFTNDPDATRRAHTAVEALFAPTSPDPQKDRP